MVHHHKPYAAATARPPQSYAKLQPAAKPKHIDTSTDDKEPLKPKNIKRNASDIERTLTTGRDTAGFSPPHYVSRCSFNCYSYNKDL